MSNKKLSTEIINKLIADKHGNITSVARSLGVSRTTIYNFINRHVKCQYALDEAREIMIDNIESALYSKALSGDTTSQIFFLKTQGKRRGYVERNEITGKDGQDVTIKVVYDE